MEHFTPTYLYVKTHNITGLKYFGKTIKDPTTYTGSGIYWKDHLAMHGNDVSTEVIGHYTDREECIEAALKFSLDNDIIHAKDAHGNKVWANLIIENGVDGNVPGNLASEETKRKRSAALKGRPRPDHIRRKISESHRGKIMSEESRQRMREAKINNPMPEEQRKRLSDMYTGRVWSEEEKSKLKGKIVVVDREGNLVKITTDEYYEQDKNNPEYVHFRTKEAKLRRNMLG